MKSTLVKIRFWLLDKLAHKLASEQGDVPGWVLITVMSAAIVLALWAVAQDTLIGLFEQAVSQFNGG